MKIILKTVLLLMVFNAFGQNEGEMKEVTDTTKVEAPKKKFDFSGSADVYYRANITAPNDEDQISPGTSFADKSGFALGMANLVASYAGKKVGFTADLVFGPRGEAASATMLNQLFATYSPSDKVKLTMGKFNTFLGYEVISPTGNFNYSTSYLFSNGPFSHTGLKADFILTEDLSVMLGVMNQTDITEFNPDASYGFGMQVGFFDQFLNVLYDKNGLGLEVDYTGGFDITEKFFLGINGAIADNEGNGFYGGALYPQVETCKNFTLGLRGEFFGMRANKDAAGHVIAGTLTGSYEIHGLTIKPEVRADIGKDDYYIDTDSDPSNILVSALLGVIYAF